MIQTFWYMIKLAIVIVGVVWLLSLDGAVVLEWDAYKVTAHTGFFLFLIALGVLLVTWVTRGAIWFENIPKLWKIYRKEKQREQGHVAILRGLTALSAGDAKIAEYQAQRAQKLSPAEDGLAQLLSAHAARMNGRTDEAEARFQNLAKNKETAMLGYQGLIKTAYEQGQEEKALSLAYQAYNKNHKNKDFLPRIYEMECESRAWPAALKTLSRLEKTSLMDKYKMKRDRAALLTQMGLEAKQTEQFTLASEKFAAALKACPDFLPAALELAAYYLRQKDTRRLKKLIENQWRNAPHPELAKLWMDLLSTRKAQKPNARLDWIKRLSANNPDHIESKIAIAKVAMEDGLWGEARGYLLKAEAEAPRQTIYRMLEEIAHCSDHDNDKARIWADKGIDAPADPAWMCENTGRIYAEWQISTPPNNFNTIKWRAPRRLQISGITSPYGTANALNLENFIDR
ncbi:MAG: heme biosynthesis HemY N-terminal domain-containing protein [Pseudomonadota bacterium]|jgi:HemY protein|nr:heme biosynthesis HemY N-terminal domain-containing protein [Pseudomonadota bacterium]MEC9234977.1 heme biosynthesis HemY N-terminal domain-containing protein [Pseudomonadota bacterium]